MIQNSVVTPLFVSLHWLPVAARIQFKTLMLAYRTTTGSAPAYFHSLLQIYIPSRSLKNRNRIQLKKSESYSQYNHPHLKNNLKACVRPLRQHVVVAHKILMFKTVQIHTQGSHMQPNFSMVRLKKI